jgi:hypothetical protein
VRRTKKLLNDGNSLALPTRQLHWVRVLFVVNAKVLKESLGFIFGARFIMRSQHKVAPHRAVIQQRIRLLHHPNFTSTYLVRVIQQPNGTSRWLLHASNTPEELSFTRPR